MDVLNLKGAIAATSLYFGDKKVGQNFTIKTPDITPTLVEVTAAGGTVEIPVPTKIEAMESTFTMQGVAKVWLKKLDQKKKTTVTANLIQTSTNEAGTTKAEHIKVVMTGFPKVLPGIEATYGETTECEIAFATHSVKVYIDGELYTHVDPIKMIYKINGVDYTGDVAKML